MHGLSEPLHILVAFPIVLGVLVSVHEYGHYLAARLLGFHVEAFAIGFGRPIASWLDKRGTRWQIGWLPLGGFVRLHGQMRPEDMTPEERAALRPGEGFHDRSLGARAIVTISGPVANFLLSIVLFTLLAMAIGVPMATPVVGDVAPNQAGARAGLRTGDRILSIDGTPIKSFTDIQTIVVAHPDTVLQVTLHRGTADITLAVTPDSHLTPSGSHIGMLGIRSGEVSYTPVGAITAVEVGFEQTWGTVQQIGQGLWQIISGQRSPRELGGVLRIAQLSGQAASLGIPTLVGFIALLSVNLGLLNLLPIPVLDGGHLIIYALEAIRGKPLPARALEYSFRVGLGLILTLLVFTNVSGFVDLLHWVRGLIG